MTISLTNAFTKAVKVKYPIIQAPCAGHTGVDLVAAVSNAGGLGSLAAGMMPPNDMRTAIRAIKQATTQPFAVNLFCRMERPPTQDEMQRDYPACDKVLDRIRSQLGITRPTTFTPRSPPLDQQIAVIIEEQVPVVSYTFGYLPEDEQKRLQDAGVYLIGTATTVKEALVLAGLLESSVKRADAVVAQGLEAGGHRGSFLKEEDANDENQRQMPTEELVPKVVKALREHQKDRHVPVLAAGGLSTGTDIAKALHKWQADGAAAGTLFMLTTESTTPAAHRKVLLESKNAPRITRGLSGRWARGFPNAFMDAIDNEVPDSDIPSYDIHSARTKDIVAHAGKNSNPEYMLLWSGSHASDAAKYSNGGTVSAGDMVNKIVKDIVNASPSSL
ncbi:hypothetical protein O0I10_002638 [Lichtheimia ornata]|uniref:2-nitropropane dioxygenase n=1 Tax=Lichtheimia ornata TaxID=688661 RepID=A0AAD7VA93_9FUNG|nr:uncharacterized protein O0I10_002638 [Lichtheimia ornata]KAJ8661829.1 hypothetical protein O0I10_002638 [Lichtheimia ornata]